MTIKTYKVKATVDYTYLASTWDTDWYTVEIDDEDEPFADDELRDVLFEEIWSAFAKRHDFEDADIDIVSIEEI